MRPTKFTTETKEVLHELSTIFNSEKYKNLFPRFHKDNIFNRRFSGVLDSFMDLDTITERLEENIKSSIEVAGVMGQGQTIDQEAHRKFDRLTKHMKADFRALYINSKIFLDDYTSLLRFIFGWRGIGDKSITSFYNDLKNYSGSDASVIAFKEACLRRLKAVDDYITQYRDLAVVHNQQKHKQGTEWFMNNMNGEILFMGGNRSSITPQEILFIVVEYVDSSTSFCLDWLEGQQSTPSIATVREQ